MFVWLLFLPYSDSYCMLLYSVVYVYVHACAAPVHVLVFLFQIAVTVHYEDDLYSVEEEAGFVTLVLVLEGDAAIPVTVSASTLDLLNSSVGDAATGEL